MTKDLHFKHVAGGFCRVSKLINYGHLEPTEHKFTVVHGHAEWRKYTRASKAWRVSQLLGRKMNAAEEQLFDLFVADDDYIPFFFPDNPRCQLGYRRKDYTPR